MEIVIKTDVFNPKYENITLHVDFHVGTQKITRAAFDGSYNLTNFIKQPACLNDQLS